MSQKLSAGMPASLDLPAGWTLQFAAVDPSSGAAVNGVTISAAAIIASQIQGSYTDLSLPSIAPIWVPIPLENP